NPFCRSEGTNKLNSRTRFVVKKQQNKSLASEHLVILCAAAVASRSSMAPDWSSRPAKPESFVADGGLLPLLPSSRRRRRESTEEQQRLKEFLALYGFEDVHSPRLASQWEMVQPIHLAAEIGDGDLVRMLLAAGVDRAATTSSGKTPADFARAADSHGSHIDVLYLLCSDVKVLRARAVMMLANPKPSNTVLSI
ncbi:unnamed protein product, partial [Effrenium voratum]